MEDHQVSSAPGGDEGDRYLLAAAERLDDKLRRTLAWLQDHNPAGVAQGLRDCAEVFESLDERDRWTMVLHPLYRYWWVRLMGVLKQGQAVELWLLHLPRFLLVPAVRAGRLEGRVLTLLPNHRGELRFPGHGRHLVIGHQPVRVQQRDGRLLLQGLEHTELAVSSLLDGPVTSDRVCQRTLLGEDEIELDADDDWVVQQFEELNAQDAEPPYPKRDLRRPAAPAAQLGASYGSALALISRAWPELRRELGRHVRLIVPFQSSYLVGWSSVLFQGAIFVRAAPHDVPFTVTRLAHEASHNRLYAIQATVRLHENANGDLLPSPLRLDPRPVSGVYHATFVTGRLIQLMTRMAATTQESTYANSAETMRPGFDASVELLLTRARLTTAGRHLLEDLAARTGTGMPARTDIGPPPGLAR
jgi:HEXXH motif-containing protein